MYRILTLAALACLLNSLPGFGQLVERKTAVELVELFASTIGVQRAYVGGEIQAAMRVSGVRRDSISAALVEVAVHHSDRRVRTTALSQLATGAANNPKEQAADFALFYSAFRRISDPGIRAVAAGNMAELAHDEHTRMVLQNIVEDPRQAAEGLAIVGILAVLKTSESRELLRDIDQGGRVRNIHVRGYLEELAKTGYALPIKR